MKQICSSVVSEGGYEQTSIEHVARRTTTKTSIGTTFLPLVSIRLASTALNAVVLPVKFNVMPTSTGDDFEVILAKNSTGLTSASWAAVSSDANVEQDTSATAMTVGTIVDLQYVSSTRQFGGTINQPAAYNWDLQLGSSLTGTSDIYTLGIRVLFRVDADSIRGTIDIPQQMAKGLELRNILIAPPKVHFELPAGPGKRCWSAAKGSSGSRLG